MFRRVSGGCDASFRAFAAAFAEEFHDVDSVFAAREIERRAARVIEWVDFRAGIEQQLDDVRPSALGRAMQSSPTALAVLGVEIEAGEFEHAFQQPGPGVSLARGEVERRFALVIGHARVRAAFEKEEAHLFTAPRRGPVERGGGVRRDLVRVCASVEQAAELGDVALASGEVEGVVWGHGKVLLRPITMTNDEHEEE